MVFNIKDFLNLDVIDRHKLLTEPSTIEEKNIESISVIELPVENFVHKNELVLSTCIGCADAPDVFLNFVKDVYNSGASALVISVGRYVKETPENVVDFANSKDFPLIEIPWEIRFAGIIESVLEEINNAKQANLKIFENLQRKLLNLFLEGSTLSEAANLIYEELGNQVVIANTLGTVRGDSRDSDELLKFLKAPLNILSSGKNLSLLSNYDEKDKYTVYKISSKNMVHGYLYLKTIKDENQEDYVKDNKTYVARHIVSSLSFWFNREQTIFETEMHHKDNFVWNLVQAEEEEFKDLYTQAENIGFDLSVEYISIVGMISNFEKSYEAMRFQFSSYEEWKFNCIQTVKSNALRVAQTMDKKVMITYQKDRLIIFLQGNDETEELSNKFLNILERKVKAIYPPLILSWGINIKKTNYKLFKKSYLNAKISLEIAREKEELGFRSIYRNTSIYILLSIISNHEDAQEIISDIIGSIIEYDSENQLELIETFKVYTENMRNVSQTARMLHLHRQSLLYRLRRIEEITGLSTDNADDIFLLELCIRLWDRQNNLIL